jgi:hypothetical protein
MSALLARRGVLTVSHKNQQKKVMIYEEVKFPAADLAQWRAVE